MEKLQNVGTKSAFTPKKNQFCFNFGNLSLVGGPRPRFKWPRSRAGPSLDPPPRIWAL